MGLDQLHNIRVIGRFNNFDPLLGRFELHLDLVSMHKKFGKQGIAPMNGALFINPTGHGPHVRQQLIDYRRIVGFGQSFHPIGEPSHRPPDIGMVFEQEMENLFVSLVGWVSVHATSVPLAVHAATAMWILGVGLFRSKTS